MLLITHPIVCIGSEAHKLNDQIILRLLKVRMSARYAVVCRPEVPARWIPKLTRYRFCQVGYLDSLGRGEKFNTAAVRDVNERGEDGGKTEVERDGKG